MRNYSDNEGRDLVEYYLNLNTEEVTQLKLHLFEIRGRDFDYFFLDENCSYRLLASISTVRPELNLLDDFGSWAIPIDTIKKLEKENLVEKIVDHPSATRRLYFHNSLLSQRASEEAINIAKGEIPATNLANRSENDTAKILYVAAEYNSLLISQDKIDRNSSKDISHNIMKARINIDQPSNWPSPPKLQRTSDGHPSGRYTIAGGSQNDAEFMDLSYRSAYHTFEDRLFGFNPGAEVVILNYGLRLIDDKLKLQQFELIQVKSRTPRNAFFAPPSWDFGVAYQEKYLAGKNHHVLSTEYFRGRSILVAGHILSGLIGGSIDLADEFDSNIGIEVAGKLSALKQTDKFSYQLSYRMGSYIDGVESDDKSLSASFSLPLYNDLLSISAKRKLSRNMYQTEFRLGYSRYF
ncbi:hypothetical protein R50072_25370 [Simiduia litorea]